MDLAVSSVGLLRCLSRFAEVLHYSAFRFASSRENKLLFRIEQFLPQGGRK
jgi:hypothetical protein